jgi:3-dehydroquinate synthetase
MKKAETLKTGIIDLANNRFLNWIKNYTFLQKLNETNSAPTETNSILKEIHCRYMDQCSDYRNRGYRRKLNLMATTENDISNCCQVKEFIENELERI